MFFIDIDFGRESSRWFQKPFGSPISHGLIFEVLLRVRGGKINNNVLSRTKTVLEGWGRSIGWSRDTKRCDTTNSEGQRLDRADRWLRNILEMRLEDLWVLGLWDHQRIFQWAPRLFDLPRNSTRGAEKQSSRSCELIHIKPGGNGGNKAGRGLICVWLPNYVLMRVRKERPRVGFARRGRGQPFLGPSGACGTSCCSDFSCLPHCILRRLHKKEEMLFLTRISERSIF